MKKIDYGVIILLISIHFFYGLSSIKKFSPTYDEPVHLTAGYVYLTTGDYRYNGYHHPAFGEMWAALPLLFLKPDLPKKHPAWIMQRWTPLEQYRFADSFFYENKVDHEKLMNAGRVMQLVLSILFGLFFFIVGVKLGGRNVGLIAMTLWAFSPTFLAHGTVVSTDFSFSIFYFSFFMSLFYWNKWKGNLVSGLFLGLCIGSKYLSVALAPAVFVLLVGIWVWFPKGRKEFVKWDSWRHVFLILGTAFVTLLVIYQGDGISVFFGGLKRIVSRSLSGRSSFFLGNHSTEGVLGYFPFLFLVKTPLLTLGGLLFAFLLLIRKKMSLSPLLFIPPLVFFILTCFSKVQIGHRHILAVYPFVLMIVALAFNQIKNKKILITLMLALFVEVSIAWPRFLSFFNGLIGGSGNGYKYVTDSNVDWGQGLKELSQKLEEKDKKEGIFLSYFGVAKPSAYGIKFINVGSDVIAGVSDNRSDPQMNPTKFAISLSNYQATYYGNKDVFKWLESKKPLFRVGNSMFVYDFSNDPEALQRVAILGQWELKKRS